MLFFWAVPFIILILVNHVSPFKESRLVVPAFVMFSGSEPKDGKSCQAGVQIAADAANARPDILPAYKIEVEFKDEGFYGMKSVAETARYGRADLRRNNFTTKSPVIIGPWNTDGCRRAATFYHEFGLLGFSPSCVGTPVDGNRKIYPNLFRIRVPIQLALFAEVKFMRDVGKWRKIGLLTNAESSRDIFDSRDLQDLFERYGLTVVWARYVIWVEHETIRTLKESNARIIAVEETDIGFVVSFFCMAYHYGLTGPRYIFVIQTCGMCNPLMDVTSFPAGCNSDIVTEQMKITYWIGGYVFSNKNYGPTALGYDKNTFDQQFDTMTKSSRTADYMTRHSCYDTMMQAILTLDAGERALQVINMTLKDYATDQFKVAEVVNRSAASVKYNSLHTGFQEYSSRLEMDNEQQAILRWEPKSSSFELIYEIKRDFRYSVPDLNGYVFTQISQRPWLTSDGSPPRDFPTTKLLIQSKESIGTINGLIAITVIVAVCELVGMILYFRNPAISMPKSQKVALSIGCLFLKASIFCILEQPSASVTAGNGLCFLRISFWSLGISLINGTFAFRVIFFWQELNRFLSEKKATKAASKASTSAATPAVIQPDIASSNQTENHNSVQNAQPSTSATSKSGTSSSSAPMTKTAADKAKAAQRAANVAKLSKSIWQPGTVVNGGYGILLAANAIVLVVWELTEPYLSRSLSFIQALTTTGVMLSHLFK